MKISGVDIRPGNIIEYEGGIWRAVKIQHTQPGKGGAYMQVELKNLIDGRKNNVRFRSAETVERVRLDTKDFQFLYHDGDQLVFMVGAPNQQAGPKPTAGDDTISNYTINFGPQHPAAHAAGARSLIENTRPGSKQQEKAIDAMLQDLVACIPPNPANNPQFDPMIVRYRIAEALWRLGIVKGQPGSSAGATN